MLLYFKKEYVPLILSGRKRLTVRLGERGVRPGQTVILFAGKPFAKARIVSVRRKRLREVTESEARKGGFKDLKSFRAAFFKHYPGAHSSDWVTIIEWKLIK